MTDLQTKPSHRDNMKVNFLQNISQKVRQGRLFQES